MSRFISLETTPEKRTQGVPAGDHSPWSCGFSSPPTGAPSKADSSLCLAERQSSGSSQTWGSAGGLTLVWMGTLLSVKKILLFIHSGIEDIKQGCPSTAYTVLLSHPQRASLLPIRQATGGLTGTGLHP